LARVRQNQLLEPDGNRSRVSRLFDRPREEPSHDARTAMRPRGRA
jgi:hypothetical protein